MLAALVCATFTRALSALPIWDDEYLTIRNPQLASWRGLRMLVSTDIWSSSALQEKSGYYRPVASLSYAFNRLFGNTSASYHAGNVVLHAVAAVLLYRFVVARKIASPARAFAVAALFATMPLVAEPVSWIAGRYDLIGAAFGLAALLANGGARRLWTAPLAFGLALLSKEPYLVVIGLVGMDDLFLLRRRLLAELPKYGALVGVAAIAFALRHLAHVPQATALLEQGGVLALVRAYAFAWIKLGGLAVWPRDLCFFHTYVPPSSAACAVVLGAIAIALAGATRAWLRARANVGRAAILTGLVWCVVAMIPGALTAPTLRIIGDRYAYFPLMGAAVALAGGLELLGRRHALARFSPAIVLGLAAIQLVRLESRLGELQSPDTMFAATLARDPDNFTTLSLWGNVLARRGRYDEAEGVLLHARRVAPLTGDIDTALCFVHLRQRRWATAEEDGRRAIAGNPDNPRAWLNLASALVDQKKAAEAVDMASQALRVRPHFAEAHFVRALGYVELGRWPEARDDLRAALAIDPGHAQAKALLARIGPP